MKRFKIWLESQDPLTLVIMKKLKEWDDMTPKQINRGYCGDFNDAIFHEIRDNNFGVSFECEETEHIGYHCFMIFKNRYYDAEHPNGVDSLEELDMI